DALFERAAAMAESAGDPALIAEIAYLRGCATNNQQRFRAAPAHLWHAHELLQTQCPGESWLLTAARMMLGSSWTYAGNYQEIKRHMGGWIEEARARDDRYAIAAIAGTGGGSLRFAMEERPELAQTEIEAAMEPWPKQPFGTSHYGAFSTTYYVLGSEPGPRLLDYIDAHPELERAPLMRTPTLRFSYLAARLRGLLLALEPGHQGALLARARADLRLLEKLPGRTPRVFTLAYAASIHQISGDGDSALRCLRESAALSENIDHFCGVGVRYMLALLEGGDAGRQTRAEIRAQIEAEGWKSWQRGLAIRVPGNLALFAT
ncbi:MAG TPA: hypothetical protein VMF89_15075, partial [Polyangiales bacterium]|nr:hypothetical protein [Polyangiales bacterium]